MSASLITFLSLDLGHLPMFLPPSDRRDERAELVAFIERFPLGALVTHDLEGSPQLDHLPFLFEPPSPDAPFGVLTTHVARANPQWRALSPHPHPALLTFQSPGAYISPRDYATSAEHSRHVPTFHYVAVHARGLLHVSERREDLLDTLTAHITHFERHAPSPWRLEEADPGYRERLLGAILAMRLVLTSPLIGKYKLGQKRDLVDRRSTLASLQHRASLAERVVGELCEQELTREEDTSSGK